MTQVTRVEKVEETTFVDPPRQPLPANPPILPLMLSKAKFFVWDIFISGIQAQISGLSWSPESFSWILDFQDLSLYINNPQGFDPLNMLN